MTKGTHRYGVKTLVEDSHKIAMNQYLLAQVATHLFRTKGYHGTSIRDIAQAARMSIGAVYQYVRAKEDLVLLILAEVVKVYEDKLLPLVDLTMEPWEKLRWAIDVYYHILDENHEKTQVLYRDFGNLRPKNRQHLNEIEDQIAGAIQQMVEQGIAAGRFRPVSALLIAHNLTSLGHMWALKRWRFKGTMTIDEYISAQQDCLSRILIADGTQS